GGATVGARPGSRWIRPSATNAPKAWRTTLRATPNCWQRRASLGNAVPGANCRPCMSWRKAWATCTCSGSPLDRSSDTSESALNAMESASGCGARSFPYLRPARGQTRGALGGQYQAVFPGDALAGDVERGAVIDRHAHDRQADRDVDAVVAVDRLERGMALIVIAGNHEFPFAAHGLRKQGVRGNRARGENAGGIGFGHGRRQNLGVLRTENAVFAGVRIQTRNGDRLITASQRPGERASQTQD